MAKHIECKDFSLLALAQLFCGHLANASLSCMSNIQTCSFSIYNRFSSECWTLESTVKSVDKSTTRVLKSKKTSCWSTWKCGEKHVTPDGKITTSKVETMMATLRCVEGERAVYRFFTSIIKIYVSSRIYTPASRHTDLPKKTSESDSKWSRMNDDETKRSTT